MKFNDCTELRKRIERRGEIQAALERLFIEFDMYPADINVAAKVQRRTKDIVKRIVRNEKMPRPTRGFMNQMQEVADTASRLFKFNHLRIVKNEGSK